MESFRELGRLGSHRCTWEDATASTYANLSLSGFCSISVLQQKQTDIAWVGLDS